MKQFIYLHVHTVNKLLKKTNKGTLHFLNCLRTFFYYCVSWLVLLGLKI